MTSARRLIIGLLTALTLTAAVPAFAAAAGNLESDMATLEFPSTGIHDPAATLSAKITNNGDEDATIESVGVAAPFAIDLIGSECDDNPTLGPSSSCNLVVRFAPTVVGPASANVTIAYDDSVEGRELTIGATGTGANGTIEANTPSFNVEPYYFGGQQQGVNVFNPSSFTVLSGNPTISGADAGNFNINGNNCNGYFIQPNQGCGITVQFSPSGPGTFTAQLEIPNDGTVGPVVVPLTAEALAGPKATITPGEVDFGMVEVGSSAAPRQVTIANDGDFPLQIQQLLIISGTPLTFPISNDGCSLQQIVPGDECEVTVTFSPTKAGERNASIFLITNTPGPITTSSLTGEGVAVSSGTVQPTAGPRGPAGPVGPAGARGKTGAKGPRGKPGKSAKSSCKGRSGRSARAKSKCATKHSRNGRR